MKSPRKREDAEGKPKESASKRTPRHGAADADRVLREIDREKRREERRRLPFCVVIRTDLSSVTYSAGIPPSLAMAVCMRLTGSSAVLVREQMKTWRRENPSVAENTLNSLDTPSRFAMRMDSF